MENYGKRIKHCDRAVEYCDETMEIFVGNWTTVMQNISIVMSSGAM